MFQMTSCMLGMMEFKDHMLWSFRRNLLFKSMSDPSLTIVGLIPTRGPQEPRSMRQRAALLESPQGDRDQRQERLQNAKILQS
jgi:hypothetical protein